MTLITSLAAAYDIARRSVAPQHATAWLAIQAGVTMLAVVVAGVYAYLTYLFWRQSVCSNQTVLMQQLMVEYDSLRESRTIVQQWYRESASVGVDPVQRFEEATAVDDLPYPVERVDDARFAVSRFFVKIRKLSRAGFLEPRIIVMALGRGAMEDMFLGLVDPLDQVVTRRMLGKRSIADRDFFAALVHNAHDRMRLNDGR